MHAFDVRVRLDVIRHNVISVKITAITYPDGLGWIEKDFGNTISES